MQPQDFKFYFTLFMTTCFFTHDKHRDAIMRNLSEIKLSTPPLPNNKPCPDFLGAFRFGRFKKEDEVVFLMGIYIENHLSNFKQGLDCFLTLSATRTRKIFYLVDIRYIYADEDTGENRYAPVRKEGWLRAEAAKVLLLEHLPQLQEVPFYVLPMYNPEKRYMTKEEYFDYFSFLDSKKLKYFDVYDKVACENFLLDILHTTEDP